MRKMLIISFISLITGVTLVIGSIVFGGIGIINSFKNLIHHSGYISVQGVHISENQGLEEKTLEYDAKDIKELDIELDGVNLEIIENNDNNQIKITYDQEFKNEYEIANRSGKLEIRNNHMITFGMNITFHKDKKMLVQLPKKDLFKNINLQLKDNKVSLEKIDSDEIMIVLRDARGDFKDIHSDKLKLELHDSNANANKIYSKEIKFLSKDSELEAEDIQGEIFEKELSDTKARFTNVDVKKVRIEVKDSDVKFALKAEEAEIQGEDSKIEYVLAEDISKYDVDINEKDSEVLVDGRKENKQADTIKEGKCIKVDIEGTIFEFISPK